MIIYNIGNNRRLRLEVAVEIDASRESGDALVRITDRAETPSLYVVLLRGAIVQLPVARRLVVAPNEQAAVGRALLDFVCGPPERARRDAKA